MGGKITNKRGLHIKEAYVAVGEISIQRVLLWHGWQGSCTSIGLTSAWSWEESYIWKWKKISLIFLVFSALCSLGSCALDDFLCIWRSVSEKERSQVSQKPTKFLETSEKTEGEWSLFVWELMRRIQGSKFTNLSTNELFSEIDYSKCQQRIQWTYQITNVARHLTCWVVCVWHFLPECHFVQLSNCTWNSFQSGKVYLIYCNSVLYYFHFQREIGWVWGQLASTFIIFLATRFINCPTS